MKPMTLKENGFLLLCQNYTIHFIYQHIQMTGYLNGYITVNVAYYVLIVRPISQYDLIPTI